MKRVAMLAALGLAFAGASAEATVFTVTYTGKVTFGGDDTNYFGLGRELNTLTPNRGVTLQFLIDSGQPGSLLRDYGSSQSLEGDGQSSNPFIQSSFTLNGRTISYSNSPGDGYDSSHGYAEQSDSPGYDDLFHASYDNAGNVDSYDNGAATVFSDLNNIVDTTDVTAPLEYDVRSGDTGYGSFGSFRYDPSTGRYSRYLGINFDVTHVSIVPVVAVPEPASWAMMISGFGLIGGALRRRGRVNAGRAPLQTG